MQQGTDRKMSKNKNGDEKKWQIDERKTKAKERVRNWVQDQQSTLRLKRINVNLEMSIHQVQTNYY